MFEDDKDEPQPRTAQDPIPSSMADKITSINKIIRAYDYRLRGYEWSNIQGQWVKTAQELCSSDMANKIMNLLEPFSDPSLLISKMSRETYEEKVFNLSFTLNNMLMSNAMDVPVGNVPVIFQSFINTLDSVGSIILSSKEYMPKIFGTHNDEDDEKIDNSYS